MYVSACQLRGFYWHLYWHEYKMLKNLQPNILTEFFAIFEQCVSISLEQSCANFSLRITLFFSMMHINEVGNLRSHSLYLPAAVRHYSDTIVSSFESSQKVESRPEVDKNYLAFLPCSATFQSTQSYYKWQSLKSLSVFWGSEIQSKYKFNLPYEMLQFYQFLHFLVAHNGHFWKMFF